MKIFHGEKNDAYCIEYFYAKPNNREELKRELLTLQKHSKMEEGCLQYDVLEDKANQELFILILKFTSEASMKQHEQQSYVIDFMNNKMQLLCERVVWNDAIPA